MHVCTCLHVYTCKLNGVNALWVRTRLAKYSDKSRKFLAIFRGNGGSYLWKNSVAWGLPFHFWQDLTGSHLFSSQQRHQKTFGATRAERPSAHSWQLNRRAGDAITGSYWKYEIREFKNEIGILMQRMNGGVWNAGEICWSWRFWNAVGVVFFLVIQFRLLLRSVWSEYCTVNLQESCKVKKMNSVLIWNFLWN